MAYGASPEGAQIGAPETIAERIRGWTTFQPWLQHDPISQWNEIRDAGEPIVRSEELGGFWIFTRYADIEWAARNPQIFSSSEPAIPYMSMFERKMIPIEIDGDEHYKWRQALSELFNPAAINKFTADIRSAAAAAIEPIAAKGSCEFVSEFGINLPADAFLIKFGIPREHRQKLLDHKSWLHANWLRATSPDEILAANRPLWDFFSETVEARRAGGATGPDVISELLRTEYDGRPLTHDEIVNMVFMSMMAALDSTTATLGLSFLFLAEHPDYQRLIVESPEKVPTLVEELLRHAAVVTTARLVVEDVERHGVQLRKGDRVLMSWGLSGRDPEVFERPDEVDPDRASTRHLAFGIGPHRCLGMHLARRVLRTAFEEWHARIPRYHLTPDQQLTFQYSTVRSVHSLELTAGEPA
jgi:cytochrome P450